MRGRRSDLLNRKFGRLKVIEYSGSDKRGNSIWKCQCKCGNIKLVKGKDLLSKNVKSCGCLRYDTIKQYKDMVGEKFGRLKVIEFDHITDTGHTYWKCQCKCGNIVVYSRSNLQNGSVQSCGCLRRELSQKRAKETFSKFIYTKFGKFNTTDRIVTEYIHMVSRCYNKTNPSYKYYHTNNIFVSKKWYDSDNVNTGIYRDEQGIITFINDMYTEYAKHVKKYGELNTTLDRINGNKNYSKSNCRWATYEIQNNNLSTNRHIYDSEEILTFSNCVRKYVPTELLKKSYKKAPGDVITSKIDRGWSIDQILAFLKYAKYNNKLLKKQEIKQLDIDHVDQSVLYNKYPKEIKFPEYINI